MLGAPVAAEALYGYEAMEVVLDAIHRAGRSGNDRVAVARMALVPRTRRSVLGTYTLTAGGDPSTTAFAAYSLSAAGLAFEGVRGP
jgi:branched-chain amino acid transport system substrate-binding protein